MVRRTPLQADAPYLVTSNIQRRQAVHDLLSFQAHSYHALKQLQWVLGVAHGFVGPVVGVVDDAAGFVGAHGLALHHPVQRGLAVDHIVPCRLRDALEGDAVVVDDGALVALLGELHLLHAVICVGERALGLDGQRVGLDGFVVQVKLGQGTASLAERPEVDGVLHCRDTRQLLAQIVGKALAVVRGMEDTVDVVEQVFFADLLARVGCLEMSKAGVSNCIAAAQATFR